MKFEKLDDKGYKLIDEYLKDTDIIGSEYTRYGFLFWFERVEYAEGDRALYLRGFDGDIVYYWLPLVRGGRTVRDALKDIPRDAKIYFCTKRTADELADLYSATFNRNWSEYIYLAADFIALHGKRYNAKRNHVHKFCSLYDYTFLPYTAADRAEIIEFEDEWLKRHVFERERYEESALEERKMLLAALDASLKGETVCDVLRVDGKIAGLSIGVRLPSDTAVIIYEKGDISYDGVYSFLAHEFAALNFADCKYINRQEDMGLEGLRKSKLSYYPEFLLDKYTLVPKWLADGDDGREYTCRKLQKEDFNCVMSFLKRGIESLDDKKYFLNYTDEELENVLENGFMLGAYAGDRLVATCAVDYDKTYGDQLAKLCGYTGGRQFYEFSGVMTDADFRRKGIASALCSRVIRDCAIDVGNATLCAVVQFDNEPSLANLRKLGFAERAQAPYGEYLFKYLTLNVN